MGFIFSKHPINIGLPNGGALEYDTPPFNPISFSESASTNGTVWSISIRNNDRLYLTPSD